MRVSICSSIEYASEILCAMPASSIKTARFLHFARILISSLLTIFCAFLTSSHQYALFCARLKSKISLSISAADSEMRFSSFSFAIRSSSAFFAAACRSSSAFFSAAMRRFSASSALRAASFSAISFSMIFSASAFIVLILA